MRSKRHEAWRHPNSAVAEAKALDLTYVWALFAVAYRQSSNMIHERLDLGRIPEPRGFYKK